MNTKTRNILSWVIAGLLAFAFLGSGITKLIGAEMQLENLRSWGYPLWTRFPIGIGELILAIGILIPTIRKWAIYGIFIWAVIAVYTHIQAEPAQMEMLGGPIVFALLNTALLFLNKNSKG